MPDNYNCYVVTPWRAVEAVIIINVGVCVALYITCTVGSTSSLSHFHHTLIQDKYPSTLLIVEVDWLTTEHMMECCPVIGFQRNITHHSKC